jgi:hypothetical protein
MLLARRMYTPYAAVQDLPFIYVTELTAPKTQAL